VALSRLLPVSHNVRAVYQLYMGWFDGNPAHLWQNPPVEQAKRYVEFMGGAERVLEQTRKSFEEGDYRWVAEVVNHLVFAEPANEEARLLQADAFEQLGYAAENATWRTSTWSAPRSEDRRAARPARRAGRRLRDRHARGVTRSAVVLEAHHHLVDVAPAPVFARLSRADDRVAGVLMVGSGVLADRVVAAADVPARLAHPQVHPAHPHRQALLAAGDLTRKVEVIDRIQMGTG
jgi:hypothetical protein